MNINEFWDNLKQLECNIKLDAVFHLFYCGLLLTITIYINYRRKWNVQFQLEVNENKDVKFVLI